MVHVALLLLMLEAAANANLGSTISQKRNTPFLQLSTSGPADYPIFRPRPDAEISGGKVSLDHLVGGGQQRFRDAEAKRLGGLEVDD
jgi:hypothetical protein